MKVEAHAFADGSDITYVATEAVAQDTANALGLHIAVMGAIDRAYSRVGKRDAVRVICDDYGERNQLLEAVRQRTSQPIASDAMVRDFFYVVEVLVRLA